MDGRTLLLRTALRHRIKEPNIEAGYERFCELAAETIDYPAFCDAVAACLREGLIHEPVRLPEGALQCHWRLELTPNGVAHSRAAAEVLAGGCFCGAIRYMVSGTPFNATNCHCSICRRITGAPFVAWFSVRPSEFRLTQGQPTHIRSSARAERGFCGRCGTHLTFRNLDLDEIDITTASLDDPNRVPPADNTRTSSRLAWVTPDGRPDHPEARGD